ncbi:MAG: hypothetical protein ACTSQ0_08080 [Candidatus Heimdallarchaeota archaeon]
MDNGLLISSRMAERTFIKSGKITHIYGPPKIGKSTLSATIALELAKKRKKSIIISTERPIEFRMESMIAANEEYSKELLEFILTADILTIEELLLTIEKKLQDYVQDVSLVIIDSLTSTYRTNAGPITLTLLRKSLSTLQSLVINKKLAIMFTNQVASKMDQTGDFRPVAAASTRSYSDITIRLSKKSDDSTEITFENIQGEEEVVLDSFTITSAGIEEIHQILEFQM